MRLPARLCLFAELSFCLKSLLPWFLHTFTNFVLSPLWYETLYLCMLLLIATTVARWTSRCPNLRPPLLIPLCYFAQKKNTSIHLSIAPWLNVSRYHMHVRFHPALDILHAIYLCGMKQECFEIWKCLRLIASNQPWYLGDEFCWCPHECDPHRGGNIKYALQIIFCSPQFYVFYIGAVLVNDYFMVLPHLHSTKFYHKVFTINIVINQLREAVTGYEIW